MAYTGRDNTGNRDSHGWTIAGAFAGQAVVIAGIAALLAAVGTSGSATQMAAVPLPAAAAPAPMVNPAWENAAPQVQPLYYLPYQVAVDGQHGGDVFPVALTVPTFTVKPGQDLQVSLALKVPPAMSLTGMSVRLIGADEAIGTAAIKTSYNESVQAQAPGTRVFLLTWPGSASELRPGTQWTLFMDAGFPDWGNPIASITVGS
jgi:hypothetical protein